MDRITKQWMHGLIFCIGLILIVGGVATHLSGALVIGLIVATVNFQQWHKLLLRQSQADKS